LIEVSNAQISFAYGITAICYLFGEKTLPFPQVAHPAVPLCFSVLVDTENRNDHFIIPETSLPGTKVPTTAKESPRGKPATARNWLLQKTIKPKLPVV